MKIKNKYDALLMFLIMPLIISVAGCKKLVEVPAPTTSLNSANVYSTDATAIAAATYIYASLSSGNPYNAGTLLGISGFAGLYTDELTLFNGSTSTALQFYYTDNLNNNMAGSDFWTTTYPVIYKINSALEGLNNSTNLTPAVKNQLIGEMRFSRALYYFYLVNFYGDVPLVLTTDYKVNALLARTPQAQVWSQIIADLQSAQSLLAANYVDGTLLKSSTERVRPIKYAATALLARSYLYTKNWGKADSAASAVIANSSLYGISSLDNAFLKNSSEAIWQLQPVANNFNTNDGQYFVLPPTGPSTTYQTYLSNALLTSFEINDQRRTHWVSSVTVGANTYFFPYKYKSNLINAPLTEYTIVLRLAEQYLIRAEAKANNSDLVNAVNDLNVIRARAGLPNYNGATDKASLVTAILHERQVELFTEWGHRWVDLKRSGNADAIMSVVTPKKGSSTWATYKQFFPIPLTELSADPNLAQNTGY